MCPTGYVLTYLSFIPTDCLTVPLLSLYPLPHAARYMLHFSPCCLLSSVPFFTLYLTSAIPNYHLPSLSVSICLLLFPAFCVSLFPSHCPTLLSSSYTFFVLLLRKLPWLSRQSDRLLTDRSLVRSQAEAPFLLFHLLTFT